MKKTLFLSALFLVAFLISAGKNLNDEFLIANIGKDFQGIWLPEYFTESFKKNLNFASSYQFSGDTKKRPHDILIIEENKVWSNQGYHDSYGIKAEEFKKFKMNGKGDSVTILDGNGNKYIKIGDGNSKTAINTVSIWILSILKNNINKNKPNEVIEISQDNITLRNTMLQNRFLKILPDLFLLDRYNFKKDSYNLYLTDKSSPFIYGLKISDKEITVDLISESYKLQNGSIKEMNITTIQILTF